MADVSRKTVMLRQQQELRDLLQSIRNSFDLPVAKPVAAAAPAPFTPPPIKIHFDSSSIGPSKGLDALKTAMNELKTACTPVSTPVAAAPVIRVDAIAPSHVSAAASNSAPVAAAVPVKFGESTAAKPVFGALPAASSAALFSAPAFAPVAFKTEPVIAAKSDSVKTDAPLFAFANKPAVTESKPVIDVPKSQPAASALFVDSKSLPSFGSGSFFKSEPAPVAESKPLFAALPLAPAAEVVKPVVAEVTKPAISFGVAPMFKTDSAPAAGTVDSKPVLSFGLAPKADGTATTSFNFAAPVDLKFGADKPSVEVKTAPSVPTPFNFAAVAAPATDTQTVEPIVEAPKTAFGSVNFNAPAVPAISFGAKPLEASTSAAEPPKIAFGSLNFGAPSLPLFGNSETLPAVLPKIEPAVESKPDAVEVSKPVVTVVEPVVPAEVSSLASPVASAAESDTADVSATKAPETAVEAPKPTLFNSQSAADDKPAAVPTFPTFGNTFGAQPVFGVKPLSFGVTPNSEPELKSEAVAEIKETSTADEVQAPVVDAPVAAAETVEPTEPEKPASTLAPTPAPALAFPSFGSLSFGSAPTLSAPTSDSSSVVVPVKSDESATIPVFGSGSLSFPSFKIAEPSAVSTAAVAPAQSDADKVEPTKVPVFGSGALSFPSFKIAEPAAVPAKSDETEPAKVPVFGSGALSFPSLQPAVPVAVKAEPAPSFGSNIFGSSLPSPAVKSETAAPVKNSAPETSSLTFGSFGSLSFGDSAAKPVVAATNPFLPATAAVTAPVAVSVPAFSTPAFGSSVLAPSKLAIEPKAADIPASIPAFGSTTFGAAPAAPSTGFGVTSTLGTSSGFGATSALGSNAPAFGSASSTTAFGKTSAFASAAPASFSAQLGTAASFGAAPASNGAFASSAPASFSAQLGTSNAFGSTGATGFAGFGKTSGAGFGAGFGVNAFATPPAAAANPFLAAQAEAAAMGFTDKPDDSM